MSWLIYGLVFLLFAGFAKLSSAILNRIMAIDVPRQIFILCELIHLFSLPTYAVMLLSGVWKDGLWLLERPWFQISFLDFVLITMGAIGFVGLVRSTIRYQRYRPPQCQVSSETKLVDFRQTVMDVRWQDRLVGLRPMRRIALLPGNEQFTLEVNTKTFLLPRMPREWDGLSIVHLADTHFTGAVTRDYFEAVCDQARELKPDLFVFTGDLIDDMARLDWIPQTFGSLNAPYGQYFVLGNHDSYADHERIRVELERSGWIDLSGRSKELVCQNSGPPIVLAGDESPWMGSHPDLSHLPSDRFRILVSHTPDNIEWARQTNIDLMLAGHTHGGQIRLPVLGPVYSPSYYGCRFASGIFWLEPTLMYVSRSISGREPIRFNCRPELTKLVLRTGDLDSSTAKFAAARLA